MQRTERELAERYFARIDGISARWSFFMWRLVTDGGSKGRRIWCGIDHSHVQRQLSESAKTWQQACKALGQRRES